MGVEIILEVHQLLHHEFIIPQVLLDSSNLEIVQNILIAKVNLMRYTLIAKIFIS